MCSNHLYRERMQLHLWGLMQWENKWKKLCIPEVTWWNFTHIHLGIPYIKVALRIQIGICRFGAFKGVNRFWGIGKILIWVFVSKIWMRKDRTFRSVIVCSSTKERVGLGMLSIWFFFPVFTLWEMWNEKEPYWELRVCFVHFLHIPSYVIYSFNM